MSAIPCTCDRLAPRGTDPQCGFHSDDARNAAIDAIYGDEDALQEVIHIAVMWAEKQPPDTRTTASVRWPFGPGIDVGATTNETAAGALAEVFRILAAADVEGGNCVRGDWMADLVDQARAFVSAAVEKAVDARRAAIAKATGEQP